MPQKVLESSIVGAIFKYLKPLPHSFWFKVHGGWFQRAGLPDIVGVLNGRFVALEVKRPGNGPTELQTYTIEKLQAAGAVAEVVYSVEDTKVVLRALTLKK